MELLPELRCRYEGGERMKVILEIPDEEIKEQLKENTYVVEGEGEKGSVDIAMLYTNGTLDFICVEGREHFVRLKYKTLPDNATNGDVIKALFNETEYPKLIRLLMTSDSFWKAPYKGGREDGNDN